MCIVNIKGIFKETVMLMHEPCINRFHPTLPVLVSGSIHVILFDAKSGIIPFSSWKVRESKLEKKDLKSVFSLEWNVSHNIYTITRLINSHK